jgi:hypothetical protein
MPIETAARMKARGLNFVPTAFCPQTVDILSVMATGRDSIPLPGPVFLVLVWDSHLSHWLATLRMGGSGFGTANGARAECMT